MGDWREEWETTRYEAPVGEPGDQLRVRIQADRGVVVRYTVQWEVWFEGELHPAVRFDTAHGYPHRDTLDWEGRVVEKRWDDPTIGLDENLNEAIDEVKADWRVLRAEFLRRKPS